MDCTSYIIVTRIKAPDLICKDPGPAMKYDCGLGLYRDLTLIQINGENKGKGLQLKAPITFAADLKTYMKP